MTVVEDVHEVLSSLTESGMSNRRGTVVTVFPTMREEAIIAWICSRYNEGVEKPKRVCFYIEKHSSLEDDETSDDLEWMLEVGDATRDFPNMLGEALLKYRMEENDLGIDLRNDQIARLTKWMLVAFGDASGNAVIFACVMFLAHTFRESSDIAVQVAMAVAACGLLGRAVLLARSVLQAFFRIQRLKAINEEVRREGET